MLCDTRQVLLFFITGKVYHYMLEKSRITRQEKVHKFCNYVNVLICALPPRGGRVEGMAFYPIRCCSIGMILDEVNLLQCSYK